MITIDETEPLVYSQDDERPDWEGTVVVNGATEDLTTGFSFTVRLTRQATAAVALEKDTGITGGPAGAFAVAWAPGELGIPIGRYHASLTAKRTADDRDWTVHQVIDIVTR